MPEASRITTPFDASSTASDVVSGIDLTNRRAIATGGASGIGVETARALAEAGTQSRWLFGISKSATASPKTSPQRPATSSSRWRR